MDDIDFATERTEAFTKVALQAALSRRAEAGQSAGQSDGICKSCREPIEAERLSANSLAHLCAECAAEDEASRLRARRCGPR